MDLLLIHPGWPEESLWNIKFFKWPPYSLALLAALTPEEYNVSIIDENIEKADYDKLEPDIVGITVMTPLAVRGYEIADYFTERDIPVILGGIHPTMLPNEALSHCDSVVQGEAENVWNTLINDAKTNSLKKLYKARLTDFRNIPLARMDLLKKDAYFSNNLVQTTRGCNFNCDFCAVSSFFNGEYKNRPIIEVIEEIKRIKEKDLLFIDDNIISNIEYAKRLFKELIPYGKRWYSQCSLNIAQDDELLKLASESGCRGLFIGFESLSAESLKEVHKINLVKNYKEYINEIRDYGIAIEGAFMFGFDHDDQDVFKKTVNFCYSLDLDVAQFSILTPFPGTILYQRLSNEKRILIDDWSKYDAAHVVYDPKKMTPQELYDGFLDAYDDFYSIKSILKRFLKTKLPLSLFYIINKGFRVISRRLM